MQLCNDRVLRHADHKKMFLQAAMWLISGNSARMMSVPGGPGEVAREATDVSCHILLLSLSLSLSLFVSVRLLLVGLCACGCACACVPGCMPTCVCACARVVCMWVCTHVCVCWRPCVVPCMLCLCCMCAEEVVGTGLRPPATPTAGQAMGVSGPGGWKLSSPPISNSCLRQANL